MNAAVKKTDELNNFLSTDTTSKTICVLQITRIGDLIQSCQACEELKKVHPEIRLVLIAREQFVRPLKFITDQIFDRVYLINSSMFINEKVDENIELAKEKLEKFIDTLKEEQLSVLVNLSYSKSSGFLSSLIPARFKLGLVYNEFGKPSISDKWSQYIYSNVMGGSLSGIQLVDIYKLILGLTPNFNLINKVSSPKENNIVIHPFASIDKKKWKPTKWAEIIYKTLKENPQHTVTLVGSKSEEKLVKEIIESPTLKELSQRVNDLVGKTSMENLFHVLQKSTLFIGHDSMVGHLASYCNIPTLTISLGTVRPYETTPYHNLAYNISPTTKCFPCFPDEACENFKCHTDIPFQLINSCVDNLIKHRSIDKDFVSSKVSPFHCSSVDIFKVTQSNKNLLALEEVTNRDQNLKDIFRVFYRFSWLYFLSEIEENIPLPELNKTTYEGLLNYAKGIQNLFELCEFGQKYSKYILEEISSTTTDITKIKGYSNKIDEIDRLQTLTKNTFPFLDPIVDFFTLSKSNLSGSNIVELTESSFLCYQDNANFCCIIYELIEQTITNYTKNIKTNPLLNEARK